MYINKDSAIKLVNQHFEEINIELQDKLLFLTKLIDDDDWSFVIKSHALIEALVTELIIAKLNSPEIKSIIERLPLHGDQLSKIKISNEYGFFSSEQKTFISKLSTIRNSIVHKYENINFSFDKHIESLNKDNLKNWKKMLADSLKGNSAAEQLINDSKLALWNILWHFVSYTLQEIWKLKSERRLADESKKTTDILLKDLDVNISNDF